MTDLLTASTLRAAMRALAGVEMVPFQANRFMVSFHPRNLCLFWEPGLRLKLLSIWWGVRPSGWWTMDEPERIRRVLFWMECRPWQ